MNTTPETAQSLETHIDAQLGIASAKLAEIERIQTVIGAMETELAGLDTRIVNADGEAAAAELQARMAGVKPPKVTGEADALHGAHRRLSAAIAQAMAMQTDLAAERDEAFATADRLAKSVASIEFAEQSKRVADAWVAYGAAFAAYSAGAAAAGQPFGWNGSAAFSPQEGLRYEPCEGQKIRVLDYDQQVYSAAIGRSNAARVAGKIDAARLP